MPVARLVGICAIVLLYLLLPGVPLSGVERDAGWLAITLVAASAALVWAGLAAARALRAQFGQDQLALFFLTRARIAHTAGVGTIALLLLTPPAEELLFRGLLSSLTHPAISVAVFAFVHKGRAMKLLAAAFALAMELCVAVTEGLALSIAVHTAVNAAGFAYFRTRVRVIETEDEVRMLL